MNVHHMTRTDLDLKIVMEIELVRAYGMMDYTSQKSSSHLVIALTKNMMSLNSKRFIYNLSPSMGGRLFSK